MEEQKYYTPALEDLRVGLECEIETDTNLWEFVLVDVEHFHIAAHLIETKGIRVPYLTSEQIEAEGWNSCFFDNEFTKKVNDSSEYWMIFFNDLMKLDIMEIKNENNKRLYFGSGRCVNDLRTISKLLGI